MTSATSASAIPSSLAPAIPSALARPIPASLRGALWMGGVVLSLSVMAIAIRQLAPHMGSFEILFLRTLVSLAIVLALLTRYGLGALRTRHAGLHLFRNVLHFGGQYAWVYAIAILPLATVASIEFTMPVWAAVLAMLFLGERLNRGRAVMLALGLAGTLAILRPGVGIIHPAALVMLLGAVAYAGSVIATKRLAQRDSALAILFYMSLIQTLLGVAPALAHWVAPQPADVPWILVIGVGSLTTHYSLTRAFRLADASLVVPIDFIRLPLIAVVGALVYREAIDPTIMLGAAMIFAGTYYSIRREGRARPA
jgi:drug/metabolite transporter (DMT)-like permease